MTSPESFNGIQICVFFRSLGRKISLQIENDDQIDFDDLGGDDEEAGEQESSQRRESRGVSQVRFWQILTVFS